MNRFALLLLVHSIAHMVGPAHYSFADESPTSEEDTAIHVPTPPDVVAKMLNVARVSKADLVYDLGCGDGRIVIAAAKLCGCRAIGYDIDNRKVVESRENAKAKGVEKLVQIKQGDIFKLDLRKATVVTLYLLPEMHEQLIPQLKTLRAGSRVVTHEFPIAGIQHDQKVTIQSAVTEVPHDIYLYKLPLQEIPNSNPQSNDKRSD